MSRFTEKAKEATEFSFLCAGRNKVSTEDIIKKYPKGVTIVGADKVKKDDDEFYVLTIAEDDDIFFFSGSVLTNIADEWLKDFAGDCKALTEALNAEGGCKVKLHYEKSANTNRQYVAVDVLE